LLPPPAGLLLDTLFGPEGDIFLRNVGICPNYTAHCSQLPQRELQIQFFVMLQDCVAFLQSLPA
jgi:hypothetical protein